MRREVETLTASMTMNGAVAEMVKKSKAPLNGKIAPSHITSSADAAHLHTPPALAYEPNVLATFGQAVQMCGVVGEVRCAKVEYLMLTSRLLNEPVSGVVKGLSGSGKS
ncbi:MAG TPA: hypothetical protein VJ746_06005, partial [Nitrospira sp.]|nr:hypothetical protein [Nitrospira sp.]